MVYEMIQSAILGLAQGLGEFLPISSTAHLALIPYFFSWNDPGLSFDVALHLGTLFAVIIFFWRDWIIILKLGLQETFNFRFSIFNQFPNSNDKNFKYPSRLMLLLIVASAPGAFLGLFLEDYAEHTFRQPLLIASMLSIIGFILYLVDKYAKHKKDISQINIHDALVIGISQAVAIIPGASRSGVTITAALALGFSREQAARFSFLLSTPIIFSAAVLKIPQLIEYGITLQMVLGIFAATVSGYLAIKYLLKFIEKVSYKIFFWYRLALAILVAIVYFIKY